jgi:hypothetical protein
MKVWVLFALLMMISAASAVSVILNESYNGNIGDSNVNNASATTNYGTAANMFTGWVSGVGNNRTVNMFNFSAILPTSGITITGANYSLYSEAYVGAVVNYDVYNTTGSWTETGVTWNNQPSADTVQGTWSMTATGRFSVSVTNAVLAGYANIGKNVSFMVRRQAESGTDSKWVFTTKEGTAANRPYLNITYTTSYTFPESNLVGYWKFDEGSGNFTVDSSGNENLGMVSGASWTTSKYNLNNTLNYNGVNQRVDITNSVILNVSSVTVSAWVNPSSVQNGDGTVILKADGADTAKGYRLLVTPSASWMYIGNGTEQGVACSQANTGWNHFVGSFNATTKLLSIYKNGVLCNSGTIVGTMQNSSYQLQFAFRPNWNYYWNGTIDEVKIYNVSQSASWVLSEYLKNGCLYNMNVSCYNESSTSQQIYYNLILTNTTASQTFSSIQNWTSNEHCNGSTPMNSVTASISNTSFYGPRTYYAVVDSTHSKNLTAYLLPLSDLWEIDVTILVKNELGGVIPNAVVTMMKSINGGYVTVAQDTSDGGGQTYFNLDKQTAYQLIANATGYDQYSVTFQPTQSIYTITLTSNQSYNTSLVNDSMWGIFWNMTPRNYMVTGVQNFNFSIYCSNDDLEFWGMNITYNGSLQFTTNQTDSAGGFVNYTMNTSQVEGNGINVTIFFKRINYPYFDPTYKYWGYSIVASDYSLVAAMANVGNSALSPVTKGIIAIVLIVCVMGYVATSVSFSGGVVLGLLMMWGFASFGFFPPLSLLMITIVGIGLVVNRHFMGT